MQVLVLKKPSLFDLKDELHKFELDGWVQSGGIECVNDIEEGKVYFSIVVIKGE